MRDSARVCIRHLVPLVPHPNPKGPTLMDNLGGILRLISPMIVLTLAFILIGGIHGPHTAFGEFLAAALPLLGALIGLVWAVLYDDRKYQERRAAENARR